MLRVLGELENRESQLTTGADSWRRGNTFGRSDLAPLARTGAATAPKKRKFRAAGTRPGQYSSPERDDEIVSLLGTHSGRRLLNGLDCASSPATLGDKDKGLEFRLQMGNRISVTSFTS